MKHLHALLLILLVFTLSVTIAFGQPGGGGPGGGAEPAPIGGLEYLLLAGGALGIKKIISNRKKNKG